MLAVRKRLLLVKRFAGNNKASRFLYVITRFRPAIYAQNCYTLTNCIIPNQRLLSSIMCIAWISFITATPLTYRASFCNILVPLLHFMPDH